MIKIVAGLILLCNTIWVTSGKGQLSDEEKQAILDNHNFLRSGIALNGFDNKKDDAHSQPAASNMQLLEWDDELADTAHEHAKKCEWKHFVPDLAGYGQLGQNLATRDGPRYAVRNIC